MDADEIGKIARNESLFREVNERIAESAERFHASETHFACECGDPRCTNRIEAPLDHYHRVREEEAPRLVRELDPRAA